eukprot:Seg3708.3 transcript_id=Seg3708.3/GoldUCD/mRNA.D3Y31 product="hypothetical protein" protein_id=Seg3708.3/GoldUCD/D3Y31
MAANKACKKKSDEKKGSKTFSWTDEETSLLLQVVIDYKASKTAAGLDWETVKTRYEDITERFQAQYPRGGADANMEEYPNFADPSKITKERIIPRLKRIKLNFRKAIDSGRRSGGGRVVLALYDECNDIWGGSPAVDSIDHGIESSVTTATYEIDDGESSFTKDSSDLIQNDSRNLDADEESLSDDNNQNQKVTGKDMGQVRRNLIQHLKEKRDSKLTKRISTDAQLMDIAAQELKIKKQMLTRMEENDRRHEENMKVFADSMKSLAGIISQGFNMIQTIMLPPNQFQQQPMQNVYGRVDYHAQQANRRMHTESRNQNYLDLLEQEQF